MPALCDRGPTAEAVLTSDGELGCRKGGTSRYRAQPRQRFRLAGDGGTEQLTGLAAKLVEDVSSEPRSAFRLVKKTKMVEGHE